VLVLANADGLGVNLDQFRERLLQAACDGDGSANGQVEVGELLAGAVGSRVNAGPGLTDRDREDAVEVMLAQRIADTCRPPEPDPEKNSSTIFAGAGLRSRLVPPAGWGAASLNVPGRLASGPMRLGGDSTIVTPCVPTSAPFSRTSGIWVILIRQLPPLLFPNEHRVFPCQLPSYSI
jgi:hypothetical protein